MPFKCKLTIKVTRIPSAIGMLMWLLFLRKIKYDIEQVVGIQCDPSKTTHGGDKSPWDRSAGQVLGFWVSFLTKHQRGPDRGEAQAQDPSSLTGAWAAGGSHFPCSALIPTTPPESFSLPADPLAVRRPPGCGSLSSSPAPLRAPIPSCLHFSSPSFPATSYLVVHSLRCLRSPTLAPNRCSVRIAPMHSCCRCEETQTPHPPTLPSSIWGEMRLCFFFL